MSMLRYLSPGRGGGRDSAPAPKGNTPTLHIHVLNYGIIYMPPPAAPEPDGTLSDPQPRDDKVLHGELEVRVPGGPRRCKAIRVGLRTVITLDMGPTRKAEEDVLFERKVEIIGATADGIWLAPGSQRFDFTIIIPSNLAPHDWHSNGTIMHDLYAELEGVPEPQSEWGIKPVGSSTSLFGMRKGKRSPTTASRNESRTASPSRRRPHSNAASGTSTPVGNGMGAPAAPQALAGALASLDLNEQGRATPSVATTGVAANGNGHVAVPYGGGSGLNPGHVAAEYSLTVTRQEVPFLPRTPAYDDATAHAGSRETETPWLQGMVKAKRSVMIVYNPNPTGGVSELNDRANGFVNGLGVWELKLISDVWTISALLQFKINLTSLPLDTTVFCARIVLAQTHTVVSPRDEDAPNQKLTTTRHFPLYEGGKRPPVGHHHPDKYYPALWRGRGAGGKDGAAEGEDGGAIHVDRTVRLPTDNYARPSTLPGVVTPIVVSHALVLEVYFSVYGEDDRGEAMRVPGPGGLRMLRVSRPVTLPSCALIPQVVDLPPYDAHHMDRPAPGDDQLGSPTEVGVPGWEFCACGVKLEDMETRMREAVSREQATQPSLGQVASAAAADDKLWGDRGRQARHGSL